MLISAVMPIMSVYRLPHGQYGYSGHIVNLPQDVASFAQSLPKLPSDLDVIIIRKEGANQTHRDFQVRRGVVHRALQWLVTHNQYYRALGITIDITSLEQLPQDRSISHLLSVTNDCSSPDNPATIKKHLLNVTVIGVRYLDNYKGCYACSGKVTPRSDTLGECNRCESIQRLERCTMKTSAKVDVETNNEVHTISAFSPIINEICNESACTAETLLSCKPFDAIISDQDVILSITR